MYSNFQDTEILYCHLRVAYILCLVNIGHSVLGEGDAEVLLHRRYKHLVRPVQQPFEGLFLLEQTSFLKRTEEGSLYFLIPTWDQLIVSKPVFQIREVSIRKWIRKSISLDYRSRFCSFLNGFQDANKN
jgi:hypothetical protein